MGNTVETQAAQGDFKQPLNCECGFRSEPLVGNWYLKFITRSLVHMYVYMYILSMKMNFNSVFCSCFLYIENDQIQNNTIYIST